MFMGVLLGSALFSSVLPAARAPGHDQLDVLYGLPTLRRSLLGQARGRADQQNDCDNPPGFAYAPHYRRL